MPKTLLIIPAYNEALNIEKVVCDLIQECPSCNYVIVNDGSTDKTAEICKKKKFNIIDLPVNLGLAGAVQAGMKYALYNDYEYAIQFDGDGQHDAKYIEKLIDKAESSRADVIIGSRYVNKKKPHSVRMLGSNIIAFCIAVTTGKRIKDPTSGMRLYSRKVITRLAKEMNLAPEPDTMAYFIRCGYNIEEIQVEMKERTAGESYLNVSNSIKYMMNICASILIVQWFRWRVK